MSEFKPEKYYNMTAYERAKLILTETYENLTPKQKKYLSMSLSEELALPSDEKYERIRFLLFIDGLKKVIELNGGVQEPTIPQIENQQVKRIQHDKWNPDWYNKK